MEKRVDYDAVSSEYERRYNRHSYAGVERALMGFADVSSNAAVLEVGCGTGHWLALLQRQVSTAGVDPSWGMLERARRVAPEALLVQARAEQLPWQAGSFDRVFCVNALHHFDDYRAFFTEAWRLLRPGGGLLVVGLDPHTGLDRWWVYDYFPDAYAADRARYPAAAALRRTMAAAGFVDCVTREVQHMSAALPVHVAAERGLLERSSTSQLMVIGDAAWRAGLQRIHDALPAPGEAEPMLRADLRLFATSVWRPAGLQAQSARTG